MTLICIDTANQGLEEHRCDVQALNSGVNLALTPRTPAAFHKAGMLSAGGRCKTLDASADGYGRAEAIIAMLLAPALPGASCAGAFLCHFASVRKQLSCL